MLSSIQAYIFDMDGVLWRGEEPLPGVSSLFAMLTERGLPYVFATNNSSRTPASYVEKLTGFGIPATPAQVITSASATASYLRAIYPDLQTFYLVGGEGLLTALVEVGFSPVAEPTEQADIMVVGIDRALTYDKLRHACYQIQRGALFIGSNGDKSYPEPTGVAPGAGAIIALLEAATEQRAEIVGKPYAPMFNTAIRTLGYSPEQILMVGDRLETDILGAKQVGLRSALVLTGISTLDDIERRGIQPDWIFTDLAELHTKLI